MTDTSASGSDRDDESPAPAAVQPVDCNELVELVTDYFDGALSAETRVRVDLHLAECPPCRTYLEQMRLTIEATGQVELERVPAETVDRLLVAFRQARET